MNKAGAVRPAPWKEKWSEGGTNVWNATRGKEWPQPRKLAAFGKKGQLEPLLELALPPTDATTYWKTLRPPRGPDSRDRRWKTALEMRGWITQSEPPE